MNSYDNFKVSTREAIVSVLLRQIENYNLLEKTILKVVDCEVLQYISSYLDIKQNINRIVLSAGHYSYVDEAGVNNIRAIINFNQVNSIQHPNKLFRAVNTLLPEGGIYIGRASTYLDRKLFLYRKFGRQLGRILWIADFFINRVVPRIRFLDRLYYLLTNGKFHDISSVEVLGRLVYCGFHIVDYKRINGLTYFVAQKQGEPVKNSNPSYYAVVKLPRVGQSGRVIGVYKFRTMHPYSEFLQDYMIKLNGYNSKGKPANDFRVTRWGMFMRKLWIDEFPQLLNVIKGEMKLVGIRPISKVRFLEFPADLQSERIKYKPGCIPPYVALNMPDDKGNIEAERIYFRTLHKHPFSTDIKYFFKALYNITTNKIRSA